MKLKKLKTLKSHRRVAVSALSSAAVVSQFDERRLRAIDIIFNDSRTKEEDQFLADFDTEFEDVAGRKLTDIVGHLVETV